MELQKTPKYFVGSIVVFIILYGVVTMVLSNMETTINNAVTPASMSEEAINARIKPVAQVNIGEPPVIETPVVVATETTTIGGVGAKIVKQVCAVCHSTGMMQSPKLGDAKAWVPRIEKGIETLYASAINGLNMMPARGGNPKLTDDEVKAAVDHMIALTK